MNKHVAKMVVASLVLVGATGWVWANGGPFVVKSPNGDPAAKGVLARLDPSLKPARETKLRVVKEALDIRFEPERGGLRSQPLAKVTAAYTIENPTEEEVQVDFGFPILRGIYMDRLSMMPTPEVQVTVDSQPTQATIISNSMIYAVIRQNARETIEKGIAADKELAALVDAVRSGKAIAPRQAAQATPADASERVQKAEGEAARNKLLRFLVDRKKWDLRHAGLLVDYARTDFGNLRLYPPDRWLRGFNRLAKEDEQLLSDNLGPLAVIGEQKATQFFSELATCFDKDARGNYEAIFQSWGGDVAERSVDLTSGKVRFRVSEPTTGAPPAPNAALVGGEQDPTVFARVEYLDARKDISEANKEVCKSVLGKLPVVFTFAPMNLLHYHVAFPAKATRLVSVTYRQYAYVDHEGQGSFQLAYVLHPASLWESFGPIHLTVSVPKGAACRASVALKQLEGAVPEQPLSPTGAAMVRKQNVPMDRYEAMFTEKQEKTGELFIGVDREAWTKALPAQ